LWPVRVATTCLPLDELLRGGLERGAITMMYGEAGTGKTNLCLQMAIGQLREGRKVVFIDTEGISMDRFSQIAGDGHEELVKRLLLFEPYDFAEQEEMVESAAKLAMNNSDVVLIVMDSMTMHYRIELQREDERPSLVRQITTLLRVARKANVPVLVTSQVYTDVTNDEFRALGGHALHHNAKIVLRLEKVGPGVRRAVIIKHRSLAEGTCAEFRLTERGAE
jgi:DNA repair protein RadB